MSSTIILHVPAENVNENVLHAAESTFSMLVVLSIATQGLKTRRLSLPKYWEAQIGERGFQVCNSSIQLVSVNLL